LKTSLKVGEDPAVSCPIFVSTSTAVDLTPII
jgi:hypothetical protein